MRTKRKAFVRRQIDGQYRFEILQRDNFTCQFCDSRPGNDRLHVDHLLPVSRGGSDHASNLTTACDRCNLGKNDRVAVPAKMLITTTPDDEGFLIWKRFGPWTIEVCTVGMIVNYPEYPNYWFGIERCGELDWPDHVGSKIAWRLKQDDESQSIAPDGSFRTVRICDIPEEPPNCFTLASALDMAPENRRRYKKNWDDTELMAGLFSALSFAGDIYDPAPRSVA